MSGPRPGAGRRRGWWQKLAGGERLLAIVMSAVLVGGLGLIGQGMWLKMTEAQAAPSAYVHSLDRAAHPSVPPAPLR